jgi:hypothetical protein
MPLFMRQVWIQYQDNAVTELQERARERERNKLLYDIKDIKQRSYKNLLTGEAKKISDGTSTT